MRKNVTAVRSAAPLAMCFTQRRPFSAAAHASARARANVHARAQEALRVLPDAVLDAPPRAPKAQGFAIGALPPPPPQLAAPAGGAAAPAAAHASLSAPAAAELAARGGAAASASATAVEQAPGGVPACAAGTPRETCAPDAAGVQPALAWLARGAVAGPEAGQASAARAAETAGGEGPGAAAARASPHELMARAAPRRMLQAARRVARRPETLKKRWAAGRPAR